MLRQMLYKDIFLLPIMAGLVCQLIKLVIYSVMGKRFIPGGLFKPDGMPNVHASVFASLSTVIGVKYGYSSILFSVAATYSIVILHDTMRVKREKEKQVDVLNRIISSMSVYDGMSSDPVKRVLQYRPLDVLGGAILGVTLTYMML
jgi:acid phosphatase family membrane protein YuiD